jgi:rare lipoprotein A
LQLPSVVEVTNLKNGRVLEMRVNDRGPFVGDRMIDLSRRAAQLLGFESAGMAPVRVRILKEQSIQVAEAAMRGNVSMVAQAPRIAPIQMAAVGPRPGPMSAPQTAMAAPAPIPAPAPTTAMPPPSAMSPQISAPPIQQAPQPVPVAAPPPAPPAPKPMPATAPPQPQSSQPAVAVSRRPWPSLIASAHAETAPRSGPPAARHSGRIFVQAGAFAVPENAQKVRARVAALGSAEVLRTLVNGAAMYRVRLGPVASDAEARRLLTKVVDSGYPGARVIDE